MTCGTPEPGAAADDVEVGAVVLQQFEASKVYDVEPPRTAVQVAAAAADDADSPLLGAAEAEKNKKKKKKKQEREEPKLKTRTSEN